MLARFYVVNDFKNKSIGNFLFDSFICITLRLKVFCKKLDQNCRLLELF